MKAKAKTARALLALGLALGAAIGLSLVHIQQASAYTYLKTETTSLFNRHWIKANSTGYFEEIGSDPHGPRFYLPSYDAPSAGWNGRVEAYRFSIYNATDARGWSDYYCTNGSWSRGGANFGHGDVYEANVAKNGAGFGCLATYGYAWSRERYFAGANGLDDLYYSHVFIDTVGDGWGGYAHNYYGAADFWPRVKIHYDKNTSAAASGVPRPHHKYIGNAGAISSARPKRAGYTFEGWSTRRAGPVNVASGQRIGYEDWNLKKPMTLAHGWSDGPADVRDDIDAGIPSPSGTNVITLYAQWKPIAYRVSYAGNGATAGSTTPSTHVYDAAKALSPNGFRRSYALTCNAQGGSAGTKILTCAWPWRAWNAKANGSGAAYGNRASVKNLRASAGTTTLYAQWSAGRVTLPNPGTRSGYRFKGWYTASSGGSLVGMAGAAVSIGKNTTYFAQWIPYVKVSYYADRSRTPVFTETVLAYSPYRVNARATSNGTKKGCAGFEGWYVDAACTKAFKAGTAVPAKGLSLYGRNKVALRYDLTNRTRALLAGRSLFLNESLTASVSIGALAPRGATAYYGDRVSIKRGRSVWFDDRGRSREATCDPGSYASPDATMPSSSTLRLTKNTTVYLQWSLPAYDGIALS